MDYSPAPARRPRALRSPSLGGTTRRPVRSAEGEPPRAPTLVWRPPACRVSGRRWCLPPLVTASASTIPTISGFDHPACKAPCVRSVAGIPGNQATLAVPAGLARLGQSGLPPAGLTRRIPSCRIMYFPLHQASPSARRPRPHSGLATGPLRAGRAAQLSVCHAPPVRPSRRTRYSPPRQRSPWAASPGCPCRRTR